MTNYLYNGVKLPAPPLGFTGHMLLLNDAETGQYVMCYGTFYRYPLDSMPICSPSASLPTCYAIKAGMTQWTETSITPDGGDAGWTLVAADNEYIWTNNDIYWLDSETASSPTTSVAYQGTVAEIVPELPVVPDEPGVSISVGHKAMTQGWLIGRRLAAMRKIVPVLPDGYTQLEYIENNDNRYIDTGYLTNLNLKIDVDIAVLTGITSLGSYKAILGNSKGWEMNLVIDYAGLRWVGEMTQMYCPPYVVGQKYNIVATQSSMSVDGVSIEKEPDTNNQIYGNFYLFAGQPQTRASARIYACKIYDSENLVRDFVPCTNPDGAQGMWDKVEQKFYGFS